MKSDLIVHQFTCKSNNYKLGLHNWKWSINNSQYRIHMVETTETSSISARDYQYHRLGLKMLSLKASDENKDFMHTIIATIKAELFFCNNISQLMKFRSMGFMLPCNRSIVCTNN